jgi:hypothetical protein
MKENNVNSIIKLIAVKKESTLFELHQTYRMTYSESKEAVEFLVEIGVVSFDGKTFKLNAKIEHKTMQKLYDSIKFRNLQLESSIIDQYKLNAIDINQLYTPKLSLLSNELRA